MNNEVRVPNSEKALVEEKKVRNYLLDIKHMDLSKKNYNSMLVATSNCCDARILHYEDSIRCKSCKKKLINYVD